MSEQPSGVLEKAPSAGDLTEAGYDGPDLTLKRYPWRSRVTPWSRIINHEYKGSGTEEDPYVVLWLENDEEDPLNFSAKKKWLLTLLGACRWQALETFDITADPTQWPQAPSPSALVRPCCQQLSRTLESRSQARTPCCTL